MNFLIGIIDALVGFVRRNPLLALLVAVLALGAPALLRGIAIFILYFIMTLLVLGVAIALYLRWRLARVRREMEERFGASGAQGFGPDFGRGPRGDARREGDVEVRRTADVPEKRVASDVGDYVEFEETDRNER